MEKESRWDCSASMNNAPSGWWILPFAVLGAVIWLRLGYRALTWIFAQ